MKGVTKMNENLCIKDKIHSVQAYEMEKWLN